MIYTVTFNPSLDYIVRVRNFKTGGINRTFYEDILPGGKGINVSIVLSNLGHDSVALGFTAGFTGEDIEDLMKGFGCGTDFIRVKEGFSRINVKMKSDEETEINGQGPRITAEDIDKLYEKLDRLVPGDILVISGSVPAALPRNVYELIMQRLSGRGILVAADAEKELLAGVLRYRPWLVKPNSLELGDLYSVTLRTKEDVIHYARKLQEEGAQNVLVSMAGEGAVLLASDGGVLCSDAPKGTVVNSVGAGDSMVAGFISGYLETGDYESAFRMGLAAGSASAFSPALASRPEVEALLETF